MTQLLPGVALPRPARAANAGPLDDRFYDLVEERFRRGVHHNPVLATWLGIATENGRLGDPSHDAVEQEIADERAHLAVIEAIDPAQLSKSARFERDLELHNVRLGLFEAADLRLWARRPSAADLLGDSVYLLFARGASPLAQRLEWIGERLAATPAYLAASRSRLTGAPVTLWHEIELRSAMEMPGLFAEVRAAADGVLDAVQLRRLDASIAAANASLEGWSDFLKAGLARAGDDWALGREQYDELLRHRAFDDLDADAILAIGHEQLRKNHEARRAALRELDPGADEATAIDRLKSNHPATFEEALEGYRDAMHRARAHLIEHDLVTIPDDEVIDVQPTPEYLRSMMPFAAYMSPARFDADRRGIYIVTPAVDNDPDAMREHYRASISNTSVHEAYPGHHLQFAVAAHNPSLTRLAAEAPEFVEGWGMYSEQMMREQGFDNGPAFMATLYTDAIWRSCRIILDIRMHRGEMTTDEAVAFMVEHTAFETANARAEVKRYTYTPGYQLSYLLGKVLLLGLRESEKRRLGSAFSLKGFHDTLLRNGSLPISFHRRLLAGEG